MEKSVITIKKLADIIFDRFSEEELRKYDEDVYGEILNVKDRFLAHCSKYLKYARYPEEEIRIRVDKILEKSSFYKDGEFDFSIFDEILGRCFID